MDHRTHPVHPDQRAHVRALIRAHGVRGAAERLKMSRGATLSVAAGADVMPGTIAQLERALGTRVASSDSEDRA